jgi:hypothetical protein
VRKVLRSPAHFTGTREETSGITIDRARLRIGAGGSMHVVGRALVLPPWVGIDPPANGVRIVIDGVLDVTVPGGAGWTSNVSGKRWRFDDPSVALGGLRRLTIADQSSQVPGRLTFDVRFAGAPVLPVAGPVDLAIQFGAVDECATVHWGASNAARPRCQGNAQRLSCS